jgi:hypothetical protein
MHPPRVPHQQQDCLEREAEHGANSTVAGWVQRVVDQAILSGLLVLLLESSRGADDAPTDPPRLAGQDGTGTEGLPRARVRPQVRPNVTHVLSLPAPRHSPSIRPRPPRLFRSSKSCSQTPSRVGCSIRFRRCSCRPGTSGPQPGSTSGIKELRLPMSGILAGKVRVDQADGGGTFAHRCCHPFD